MTNGSAGQRVRPGELVFDIGAGEGTDGASSASGGAGGRRSCTCDESVSSASDSWHYCGARGRRLTWLPAAGLWRTRRGFRPPADAVGTQQFESRLISVLQRAPSYTRFCNARRFTTATARVPATAGWTPRAASAGARW